MNTGSINFPVSQNLLDYVNSSEKDALAGVLLGYQSQDTLHIVGYTHCEQVSAQNVIENFQNVSSYIPGGIQGCGVFFTSEQANVPMIVEKVCQKVLPTNLEDLGVESIVVCVVPKNGNAPEQALYWYSNQKLIPAKMGKSTNQRNSDDMLLMRLTAALPLTFCYSKDRDELEANLESEINDLKSKLMSSSSVLQVESSDVLLHLIDGCLTKSLPTDAHCHELLSYLSIDNEAFSKKPPKGKQQVVQLHLLQQLTGDHALEGSLDCAPIINYDLEEAITISLHVPLDVIAVVTKDSHIYSIPTLLLESAVSQLDQVQQCLLEHSEGEQFFLPRVHHFKPSVLNHMVTVIYPEGKDEQHLENVRRRLHEKFQIPPKRPVFKKIQAFSFPGEKAAIAYLENTHVGLGPSGVKDGKIAIVDGTYAYHHYMQDRFDDNKWGCAYRSLQTLVSWFKYQGYTDVATPTHRHIQQILVELGDKESSFVGSRKWIGSTEVSYVLDHLLGVASKIMFVSNGAELSSKGRELVMHFQSQGTPIMIGGGVLAHTILGVDFNESSGDLKFLILDPHYTGAEDLKVIQDKGWCGWKGPDFWDQNAYYNLCMPQRPVAI